jgi:ribosome-binding protein aMBF1 (putative translation factor)
MGQLDDAVRAYRASVATLEKVEAEARERIRKAREEADTARATLAEAIVTEAQAGTRQVEIIRVTGYSRERVRQILRAGGIEPEA